MYSNTQDKINSNLFLFLASFWFGQKKCVSSNYTKSNKKGVFKVRKID